MILIVIPAAVTRVSKAFNDSYILTYQMGYSRILLIRITYVSVNWADSMRIIRLNSLKHS